MRTEFSRIRCRIVAAVTSAMLLISGSLAHAHSDEAHLASPAITAAVPASTMNPLAVAESFNRALAAGNDKAVRALLLPHVLIYESGGVERSAAEYADHHLPADIAFMSQMKRTQLSQSSGGEGATAWVATRSRLHGRFKDKDVDLNSTETLVMTRTQNGWRIAHIHWSSAAAKKQ